ncbi:hypothetical protein [Agromyces bauzanensis]
MRRRVLDLRITRWELKLFYVLGVLLAGFLLAAAMRAIGVPDLAVSIAGAVIDLALLLLGARIFRGRGEPVDPPRAWWRMTARPKLSRWLGGIFLVLAISIPISALLGTPADRAAVDIPITIIGTLEFAVLAGLYLNSAIRLRRLPVPPKEPKFRPTVRLKP